MADAFDAALAFVLKEEGCDLDHGDTGYVCNPADPGGATNYGITQGTYSAYCASYGQPSKDVKLIAMGEVRAIYRGRYWQDSAADKIADVRPKLALCVMDWGVNGGVSRAKRYLQAALGVSVDGIVGPNTVAAVKAVDESLVIRRYLRLRAAHYRARAATPDYESELARLTSVGLATVLPTPNVTQRQFLKGWLARCRHVARACEVEIDPSFAQGAEAIG